MKVTWKLFFLIIIISFFSAIASFAQAPDPNTSGDSTKAPQSNDADTSASPTPTPTPFPLHRTNWIKDVLHDQKQIVFSPFHFKRADLKWFVPLTALTTALIITDHETSSWVSHRGTLSWASHGASRGGNPVIAAGFASSLYFIGMVKSDSKLQQTGKLALEALLDTGIVVTVMKNTLNRARPNADSGMGPFFSHGKSFPSGHSANAWSVATVVAYQYRNRPLIRFAAIAAAVAVSVSRYTGRAHFLSEVVVGSAIGFAAGRFVYETHH